LKEELSNPELIFLVFQDYSRKFSSSIACGALFMQMTDEGRFRLGSTFSKVLSVNFGKMDNMTRELYGVVQAVKHFEYYIWGRKTHLLVDCKALTYLRRCKDVSSKLYRIALILDNKLFHWSHLPGKYHPTDLLSRPDILEECRPLEFTEEEAEFVAACVGIEIDYLRLEIPELARFQRRDPELKRVIEYLESKNWGDNSLNGIHVGICGT
jgi:hypothetical protein